MKNEDILTEVDRRFKDQREFIDAKLIHLSAVVQSGFDMASHERKEIIKRQDITNGRVCKLEKQTGLIRWIGQNPKLSIPIIAIFGFGLYFALQLLGIKIFFT